jgi:hypothetical protein
VLAFRQSDLAEEKPMPSPYSSDFQMDPADCIEHFIPIFRSVDAEIVVLTCIDHSGCATECEFMVKPEGDKTQIPLDLMFGFPENRDAAAMMVASRSSGPIECLHERDIRFTEALRSYGSKIGIPLYEHVLIERDTFRLMSESMGWNSS